MTTELTQSRRSSSYLHQRDQSCRMHRTGPEDERQREVWDLNRIHYQEWDEGREDHPRGDRWKIDRSLRNRRRLCHLGTFHLQVASDCKPVSENISDNHNKHQGTKGANHDNSKGPATHDRQVSENTHRYTVTSGLPTEFANCGNCTTSRHRRCPRK